MTCPEGYSCTTTIVQLWTADQRFALLVFGIIIVLALGLAALAVLYRLARS